MALRIGRASHTHWLRTSATTPIHARACAQAHARTHAQTYAHARMDTFCELAALRTRTGCAQVRREMRAQTPEWLCLGLFRFRFAFCFRPAACYAWKDKFCICIVAIWLRPSNRLRFGALGLKCQIYSTMATTLTGAKQSGYVPWRVAEEIKKRARET